MLAGAGRLDWWGFIEGWDAMARRLLFGRGAGEDHGLMDLLRTLRKRANWVVAPRRERLIRELHRRIAEHLRRAEPGSLAERMAGLEDSPETLPTHQVAQYLFALNTSGMAVWRALALLASHRGFVEEAREELREAGNDRRMLPLLRATVYESVRLWPTTPAILRETVREVDWDGATIPARTNLLIYVPFFHRDPGLSHADRFAPELWLNGARGVRNAAEGPMLLAPFSAGPGLCPAADLLPMVGSAWLAEAIGRAPEMDDPGRLRADRRLPGTLDPFSLRFRFR
jgi:cytochrome P450